MKNLLALSLAYGLYGCSHAALADPAIRVIVVPQPINGSIVVRPMGSDATVNYLS